MVDTLPTPRTTARATGTPRRHDRATAPGRPVIAAHDPDDADYTAGDVDERARWERRAARNGASPAPRA
ncbi:hypothetical protein GJV82_02440 [Cellulosimicrobium sp. BIT-GX5]|uniref:Uncharacterized protein n=1 Tax=Cellulosimicrobium composti TaxID=2672572 RepID=A0A6N7ZEF0_9MICO|nr:hypothetical protein [Cellulosimicrobium composti]MTG87817.1 hypothetical protein [Cellulosimicrobium composti]